MSVASGASANSKKGSLASPQFCFDPETPKAMKLEDEDKAGYVPPTPLSAPLLTQTMIAKCLGQESLGEASSRPKSAVW